MNYVLCIRFPWSVRNLLYQIILFYGNNNLAVISLGFFATFPMSQNGYEPMPNTEAAGKISSMPIQEPASNKPVPITENLKEEFNKLCLGRTGPTLMIPKEKIPLNARSPLRFFQSLAYVLRSDSLPQLAVSSFTNAQGETKLYIASNQKIPQSEQQAITDIINSFLDKKPLKEIASQVFPRHLSRFRKQIAKISWKHADRFTEAFPGELANKVDQAMDEFNDNDVEILIKLILENTKELRRLMNSWDLDWKVRETITCLEKIIKFTQEIRLVAKRLKMHSQNQSLQSLSREFQFIENDDHYHAELALLKAATDCCSSDTLFIGLSKRPCYCCSKFLETVAECKSVKFNISVAKTNGKFYPDWKTIQGSFFKESGHVWANVVEQKSIFEKADLEERLRIEREANRYVEDDDDELEPIWL